MKKLVKRKAEGTVVMRKREFDESDGRMDLTVTITPRRSTCWYK
jgi:hypothetical protein